MNELFHHGIKGQHWGIRRWQNKDGSLTPEGYIHYGYVKENTNIQIKTNKDGSKTVPKDFVFSRVGAAQKDPNAAGGLYVSYGKDVNKYIEEMGPKSINSLDGGARHHIQYLKVTEPLKIPSDKQLTKIAIDCYKKNKDMLWDKDRWYDFVNDAFPNNEYGSFNNLYFYKAITNPEIGKKFSYTIGEAISRPKFEDFAKEYYSDIRKAGFDAIPDLNDVVIGYADTAMIVVNPDKVKTESVTVITDDIIEDAKKYVQQLSNKKVSDIK